MTLDAELEALSIDSLGVAELLFNVEDEFHITLSPDAVDLHTLGDVVRFIDELFAEQQGNTSNTSNTSNTTQKSALMPPGVAAS